MDGCGVIVFDPWICESASLLYTLPAYTAHRMSLKKCYLLHQRGLSYKPENLASEGLDLQLI